MPNINNVKDNNVTVPNRDFVQLYRHYMDQLIEMAIKQPAAFKVLFTIMKNMDSMNALCVSNNTLAEILDITDRTVRRAIKYFKEEGWLSIMKSGTSNVYVINPDVAWTSPAEHKRFCKFSANVLLSATENTEYLRNPAASTKVKTINKTFVDQVKNKEEYGTD